MRSQPGAGPLLQAALDPLVAIATLATAASVFGAGFDGASYNVLINLGSIKDTDFVVNSRGRLEAARKRADAGASATEAAVKATSVAAPSAALRPRSGAASKASRSSDFGAGRSKYGFASSAASTLASTCPRPASAPPMSTG